MKEGNTTEKKQVSSLLLKIHKIHKIRQLRSFHQSFKGSNRLHIIICDIQTIPGRNDSFTEKILGIVWISQMMMCSLLLPMQIAECIKHCMPPLTKNFQTRGTDNTLYMHSCVILAYKQSSSVTCIFQKNSQNDTAALQKPAFIYCKFSKK